MINKKVLFAGNPNVGKSTIFNILTGLNQHTGNWAGKTVEKSSGNYKYKNELYELLGYISHCRINGSRQSLIKLIEKFYIDKDKKLKRWGGVILLIGYVGYFIYLVQGAV